MNKVIVKVPATSANCGPGFDVLGLALDIYNEFTYSLGNQDKITFSFDGLGADLLAKEEEKENLVIKAMKLLCERAQKDLPMGELHSFTQIPPSRGMGSSATAIVGGLLIANRLCDDHFSMKDLIAMATELEGHPDNVCPALLGNLCASRVIDGTVQYALVPIPKELSFVTVVPEILLSTHEARQVLPKEIPMAEAIENVANTSLFMAAMLQKEFHLLSYSMGDHLHVPYRIKLIKGGEGAMKAGKEAGALATTISGAGSTLIAYTLHKEEEIGKAMVEAFEKEKIFAKFHILKANNSGATYL